MVAAMNSLYMIEWLSCSATPAKILSNSVSSMAELFANTVLILYVYNVICVFMCLKKNNKNNKDEKGEVK